MSASAVTGPDVGGSASGASEYSRSAAIRNGVRLVVTIRSLGQRSTSRATSGAASTTCSRLSRSRSAFLSPMRETTPSPSVRSSASLTSSAAARAGRNASGSVTSASGTNATPSRNSAASARPTSTIMRVFPTPPGPVIVTTRWSRTRATSDSRSAARPMSGEIDSGRLLGRLANRSPFPSSARGSGTTMPSAETAKSSNGRPTFLSLKRPRLTTPTSVRFLSWSRAVSDSITPPGTAKDSIREAMLTASPVSRAGSTITSPTWMPMRTATSSASSRWISTAA